MGCSHHHICPFFYFHSKGEEREPSERLGKSRKRPRSSGVCLTGERRRREEQHFHSKEEAGMAEKRMRGNAGEEELERESHTRLLKQRRREKEREDEMEMVGWGTKTVNTDGRRLRGESHRRPSQQNTAHSPWEESQTSLRARVDKERKRERENRAKSERTVSVHPHTRPHRKPNWLGSGGNPAEGDGGEKRELGLRRPTVKSTTRREGGENKREEGGSTRGRASFPNPGGDSGCEEQMQRRREWRNGEETLFGRGLGREGRSGNQA